VCALVFVKHADDPKPLIVQTEWHGLIQDKGVGENGFGYDPYFFLPDQKMTAAQLDPMQKNAISHRGQALRELITQLKMRSE
jgi:XTP/dITP diphosphohydrolase